MSRVTDSIDDLLDAAVHLLDLDDAVSAAIEDTYRRAVDLRDAHDRGAPAELRALLVAYGGLRAMMAQADDRLRALGEALDALPLATPEGEE
ncbi:MAG: hypothetical protein H6739_34720 [Alphaproteobacteria bacterium]|nr:hypothetical protein [Alphaproteobacteria bacterium]